MSTAKKHKGEEGKWENLVSALEKEARSTKDPQEAVSIYYKVGELWREKLSDPEKATLCFQKVLELNSFHCGALEALKEIYTLNNEWEKLIQVLELQGKMAPDPQKAMAFYFYIGDIWEKKLSQVDRAIESYLKALSFDPSDLPIFKALGRLYAQKKDWKKLIETLEKELEITRDPHHILYLYINVGEIWAGKLSQVDKAIETYQKALALAPNDLRILKSLARLYHQQGDWERLIEINEKEIMLTEDLHQIISLHIKNAELYEEKLGRVDQATLSYQKALFHSPSHLLAIRALERLYLRQGNWEALIKMYGWEIELTESPQHLASLHFQIGRLWEKRLGKIDEAILSYQHSLEFEPFSFEAFSSLETLLGQSGNWKDLINIYETRLKTSQFRAELISLHCRLAKLWELKFGQIDKAILSFKNALELDPGSNLALESLRRLCRQSRRWEELIQILHREARFSKDASRSAKLYYEIGQLMEENLKDKDRALESYRKALEINSATKSAALLIA